MSAFLFDRISRLINQGNIIHVVYIDLNKGISICFLIETFTKLCTKLGNSIKGALSQNVLIKVHCHSERN